MCALFEIGIRFFQSAALLMGDIIQSCDGYVSNHVTGMLASCGLYAFSTIGW